MALICRDCGASLDLSTKVRRRLAGKYFACPECGASRKLPPLDDDDDLPTLRGDDDLPTLRGDVVYCRDCGRQIKENAEICIHCGVRQATPSRAINNGFTGGPNRIMAALFALFFGAFGVHKFYTGQVSLGVGYLFLFLFSLLLFCPGVIVVTFLSLFDGIVFLCQTDDQFAAKYAR